jgi:TonB family protein
VQISVSFETGKAPALPGVAPPQQPPSMGQRTIESVDVSALPAMLREKVTQSGILQVGSTMEGSLGGIHALVASLRQIDDHLRLQVNFTTTSANIKVILIGQDAPQPQIQQPTAIRVGGNVEAQNILTKVNPVYPPLAKQARIQGTVRFNAIIGADGTVQNLQVVSGHPMLVQAALEAVKQWVYKPTLLNGNPVEVITTIDVNFTLLE